MGTYKGGTGDYSTIGTGTWGGTGTFGFGGAKSDTLNRDAAAMGAALLDPKSPTRLWALIVQVLPMLLWPLIR